MAVNPGRGLVFAGVMVSVEDPPLQRLLWDEGRAAPDLGGQGAGAAFSLWGTSPVHEGAAVGRWAGRLWAAPASPLSAWLFQGAGSLGLD